MMRLPGFRYRAPRSIDDAAAWLAEDPADSMLLGGGTEASMAGWTSTYLNASGFSAVAATWALSSHWLGLILARVWLSTRVEHAKSAAIMWSALCGTVGVLIFVGAPSPAVLAADRKSVV